MFSQPIREQVAWPLRTAWKGCSRRQAQDNFFEEAAKLDDGSDSFDPYADEKILV